MRDLRTSLLAVILWGVALISICLPALALPVAGIGLAGAVFALVRARDRDRQRNGFLILVLLCCAAVAVTVAVAQPMRTHLAQHDGRAVEAIVDVTSSASVGQDGRLWFDARTVQIGPPGRLEQLGAPVRVGVAPMDGAEPGARLHVTGQAAVTEPAEQAGLVVFGTDADVVARASGVFAIAARTRADFIARATRLPEPGAGLLPGLAVGDTRAVSEELNAAMLSSGLSHLTAVSGANY